MSRCCWMVALVVVLASTMPLPIATAQGAARQGGAPVPAGQAAPYVPRVSSEFVLMVNNSPLRLFEPREGAKQDDTLVGASISYLFASPEWIADATAAPDDYDLQFVPRTSLRGESFIGVLHVSRHANRPPEELKKVVALAENRLELALVKIHDANRASAHDRVRRAEERLEQARAVAEKRQSDVQSLRTRLIQADTSPEGIDQQQNTLRQDRLKLRVELVGLKARREAIVKVIDEATVKAKATSEEQQRELGELQKIVDIRAQAVSRAQQLAKQAAVSASDYQQTELELSRARADLAERRRLIAQQAGSEQLGRLNQQLADVQIELSTAEARVAGIDAMLERLQSKDVLEMLREYGRTTQQLDYARAEEKAAFEQVAQLKKVIASAAPPKVVEIRGPQGGNPKSEAPNPKQIQSPKSQ